LQFAYRGSNRRSTSTSSSGLSSIDSATAPISSDAPFRPKTPGPGGGLEDDEGKLPALAPAAG
jgi:hypothetical protein